MRGDGPVSIKILNGQTESEIISTPLNQIISAILMPDAMDGANVTFKNADSDKILFDVGKYADVGWAVAGSLGKECPFVANDFWHADKIKIVSDASETADRTFLVYFREIEK